MKSRKKEKNEGNADLPGRLQDKSDDELSLFTDNNFLGLNSSRRNFLKVFGYSFASSAVLAACKRPVIKAIPYAIQPPELTPRMPLVYASTFYDGHEYCAVVVKNIDGRPIKIEGNELSEYNGEGTTARVQASVLSLYDDARLKYPVMNKQRASWDEIDQQILNSLSKVNSDGGRIVLLTPNIISPSTIKLINEFGSGFGNFSWIKYDAVSYSAMLEANQETFGNSAIPDYYFQNADLVVGINADFLGAWHSPVHLIPRYITRRKLNNDKADMLYHIQFESGLSLTGSNADRRIQIKPSEEKLLLADLYNRIAGVTGTASIPSQQFRLDLTNLANRLLSSKGRSIVVSGTNDKDIQLLVNGINWMLGNYGPCIDIQNPVNIASGTDASINKFIDDVSQGGVKALLMYDVNPVYDFPEGEFAKALENIPVVVNMTVSQNETVGEGLYECPVNHYLESWSDYEIKPGQLSLAQPCINPIFDTRSFQDSLLRWSGKVTSWHDYLMSSWESDYFSKSHGSSFTQFWNKCVADGIFSYSAPVKDKIDFRPEALSSITIEAESGAGYEIIFNESIALGNGKHANNPWLMELPDPISRHCWENVAYISPADASALGVETGQVIKVGDLLTIPAFIQPGQATGTVSVALGYGHTDAGPVASEKGVNVFPFAAFRNGNRRYNISVQKIVATERLEKLGIMQMHNSQEGRPLVRDTVLSKYRENPGAGNELHEEFQKMHKSLYPDAPYDGFHWTLAIDLNACIGCGTCVIACQAENNSPTVGKEQVRLNRIMQWIKVHRYYSDDADNPEVYFQPVFCQHCDDAPCENVCPVSATTHNNEGLNQMTYNRCVGTKYCMNNCPYRVRRFNWFRFTNNKAFDYNTASDLGKMVLNPDVTVRERGVVEKCTFCVQRIQAKKLQAKLENRTLKDLEIKTACMQACPAGAIVFGNFKDQNSLVYKTFADPRRYHLLEELHTLPSVGFLTKVRNDDHIM
jgi:molybdopterin-containing oxidoreductase family iron-sulfur binding subunit